jgi:hypothetical protein
LVVDNIIENKIEYYNKLRNESNSMEVPFDIDYYYKGQSIDYETALRSIQISSALTFGYENNTGRYEYAVISDPIYSEPQVAINFKPSDGKVGDIVISEGVNIVRDGKNIKINEIEEKDVIYEVSNILDSRKSITVMSSKAEGEITNILPNKLSPSSVVIDGQTYELSPYFNIDKLDASEGSFDVEDDVSALLGMDGKVVDIYGLTFRSGPFVEHVILGNSKTSSQILPSQIQTDKGVYYLNNPNTVLELGHTYELVVDEDTIVRVRNDVNKISNIVTDSFIDNTINYKVGGVTDKSIDLPEATTYYYKGMKYSSLSALKTGMASMSEYITTNTVFIFADNDKNKGYEYIAVFDPLYTDPAIYPGNRPTGGKLGDVELNDTSKVVRDGKKVSPNALVSKDVLYMTTDLWGNNKFVLAFSTKVVGVITSINPNALSPQSVTISGVTYEWGNSKTINKIGVDGSFVAGSSVMALIGRDGKIADMYGI